MKSFVITKMGAHEALPQAAVVRNAQMKQLVHDHVIHEVGLKIKQLAAERKGAGRRA